VQKRQAVKIQYYSSIKPILWAGYLYVNEKISPQKYQQLIYSIKKEFWKLLGEKVEKLYHSPAYLMMQQAKQLKRCCKRLVISRKELLMSPTAKHTSIRLDKTIRKKALIWTWCGNHLNVIYPENSTVLEFSTAENNHGGDTWWKKLLPISRRVKKITVLIIKDKMLFNVWKMQRKS